MLPSADFPSPVQGRHVYSLAILQIIPQAPWERHESRFQFRPAAPSCRPRAAFGAPACVGEGPATTARRRPAEHFDPLTSHPSTLAQAEIILRLVQRQGDFAAADVYCL